MLGRFVLPANRLDEWAGAAPPDVEGWRWPLSVHQRNRGFRNVAKSTIAPKAGRCHPGSKE